MLNKFSEIKDFLKKNESDLVLAFGVILISLISFAAGHLTAPGSEKQPIKVEYLKASGFQNSTDDLKLQAIEERTNGMYVASKKSTKYHLPDCPGVKKIAEHNKIWFISKEEAENMGYEPAGNCPGLK